MKTLIDTDCDAALMRGDESVALKASMDAAERFALIKDSLKREGRPIPVNDIWIAAQRMETGAILLSRDRHFDAVEGLLVWMPEDQPGGWPLRMSY